MREVGMMSITDDLGRDELSSLQTSSAVTGERMSKTGPKWEGRDSWEGSDAGNERNVSLTLFLSLVILSIKNWKKAVHRWRFSSSVRVLSVSWLCSRSLSNCQRRWRYNSRRTSTHWSADLPCDTLGGTQTDQPQCQLWATGVPDGGESASRRRLQSTATC